VGRDIDFAAFASGLLDLLCVANTDGYFQWLSPRWTELLGWSSEELMAKRFLDFVHPDDLEDTLAEVEKLADGLPTISFENRYRCKDGSWRWIEWNTQPQPDGTLYAVARDITDKRAALRDLERTLTKLDLAEKLANSGHWRVDLVAGTVTWSPQVYAIHGLDPAAHVPDLESGINAYHPEDRERVSACIQAAADEKAPFDFELRLVRADNGQVRIVRSIGEPELDAHGEVIGIFGVFQDITEPRLLRDRLMQAEKMAGVGTLAAGVAHEINNPLSYIQTNALALAEELEAIAGTSPSSRLRDMGEMVREIEDGTRRIRRIVQGLKTFSRTSETQVEEVHFGLVLETAERLCMNEIRHRAELVREIAEHTPPVLADESQLVQVAVNLLVNAAQAIPENGREHRIVARAGAVDEDHVFFEIQDDGVGMSEDVLRQAFSPFFTTKPQGVGTGLGLAVSHGIVTRFGGTIVACSAPGKGTVVRVVLPRATAPAPAAAVSAESAPALPKARVLVIDDDARVARSIKRLLQKHEVVLETDPEAALGRLRTEDWDVVLCDLMMPRMGGATIYRTLASERPEIAERFVIVTGGAFTAEAKQLLEENQLPVVEKPIDPIALRATIAELVDR